MSNAGGADACTLLSARDDVMVGASPRPAMACRR